VPRKCIFLLILLFQAFVGFGQNLQLIDSIRHKLKTATGERKYRLMNALAWEYRIALPDTTIAYARKAMAFGQSLKLKSGLAESLNFIGVALNNKGDKLEAYEHFQKALKLSADQGDSVQIGHTNNNLGRLFFDEGLLARSYEHFVSASQIFRHINDQSGLAYAYQSLANLYRTQKDFKKAENNFLEAYRIRLKLHNTRNITSALQQLSRLYQEMNDHEKALKYLQQADSAGHAINDAISLAEIKTYIAESYLAQGRLNEAEAICAEGLEYILKSGNKRMLPQAYLTLGQVLLQRGQIGKAKEYFSRTLAVATQSKDVTAKMEAHYALWKVSQLQKDKVNELENYNQYLVLKDSIKDLDLARQVERLQFEVEIERKQRENDLLKLNESKNEVIIHQQKLSNIILIILIIFVSLLFFIQWRNSTKRKIISEKLALQNGEIETQREEIVRQNESLSRRNQELSDLNHEKDTLMSIVAHDLKSPLNRIKGISDVMEIENLVHGEYRTYMGMVRDATLSGLDLITDLLDVHMLEGNVEPNYTRFDISKFLYEKMSSYMPAAEAKSIHLHIVRVESEDVYLDQDYLGRILDNLISNAIKFSKRGTSVEIAADRDDRETWISIKDHGQGFSERDKAHLFQKFRKLSARPTGGESSNGLGLAIVKTLVDRMRGEIELHSEPGKGSEFIVRFPNAAAEK
jgi:signal transduction histidine kinase